jgi:hypothetical protein
VDWWAGRLIARRTLYSEACYEKGPRPGIRPRIQGADYIVPLADLPVDCGSKGLVRIGLADKGHSIPSSKTLRVKLRPYKIEVLRKKFLTGTIGVVFSPTYVVDTRIDEDYGEAKTYEAGT